MPPSPSRVLLRWVDQYGVRVHDSRSVVAHVRISRVAPLRWQWQVWWTVPQLLRHNGNASVVHVPAGFAGEGFAPTRLQCILITGRFIVRRCPKGLKTP